MKPMDKRLFVFNAQNYQHIAQLKKVYRNGVNTQIPQSVKDSLIFYCTKNIGQY